MISAELTDKYYQYLEKVNKQDATPSDLEGWNALCLQILAELMQEHREVFIRLKNR
jgi:hypothetical protein